jgi:hypothetical protein
VHSEVTSPINCCLLLVGSIVFIPCCVSSITVGSVGTVLALLAFGHGPLTGISLLFRFEKLTPVVGDADIDRSSFGSLSCSFLLLLYWRLTPVMRAGLGTRGCRGSLSCSL